MVKRLLLSIILTLTLTFTLTTPALAGTYTVQPGDSLYRIGQKFNLLPAELRDANGLSSNTIYPGQILTIPPTPGFSYVVKPGDTLYKLQLKFSVPINQLKSVNGLTSNVLMPGQKLWIPKTTISPTQNDAQLLARLVHGEARGEPYAGQVAVAAVALNRVSSNHFPNTLRQVIFQPGAFTAVSDGQFYLPPSTVAWKAALDALAGWDPSNGALYFWNPQTATSKWIWTRKIVARIGNHVFGI